MYKYKLNLKAFGEGEAAAVATSAEGTGANTQVAAENGAQTTQSEQVDATPNVTEPISFEQYMKEHKKEATKWFDDRFSKRHNDYNTLVERNKASKSIMDMLATKFGIEDSDDIEAITQALENDDYLYMQRAEENGRTVDEQREWDRISRENKLYREQQRKYEATQKAQRQYTQWVDQSNNLKAIFPSFDLDEELLNETFVNALRSGMDIESAFYAIHGKDIATGAMQYTANEVRKATAEDIAASKSRPRENGLSSRAAVKVEKDIRKMSKSEIADIANRSLRGEIIRF